MRLGRVGSAIIPDMRSEPGHNRVAVGPARAQPGLSRAGQVAVITGGSAGLGLAIATAYMRHERAFLRTAAMYEYAG